MSAYYLVFCGICITVLKEFNAVVDEPYMDEPFHVPQALAYCRGDFMTWDPKITTPPGLYIVSLILKKLFMFKCSLPMLRLSTVLFLLALPIVLTRLLSYHQRRSPPRAVLAPTPEAIVLSAFPIAWFYAFLYYTEVPSLVFVTWTVVAASQGQHWLAALIGLISCMFRQTNVIWVLYAYASSQLMYLRFRRVHPGTQPLAKLHDPLALEASPGDLLQTLLSVPKVIPDILPCFLPYALVLSLFGAFVTWNGGVALGDKANHIPTLHIPQLYYLVAFSAVLGWPVLISGEGGVLALMQGVWSRMFGSKWRILMSVFMTSIMALTVYLFTIHHPFLLSDNRHYTFYVWRRIFMFHPLMPYLFIPGYLACAWAWFLRAGRDHTLLQSLILPLFALPTLVVTPLLEPRYFLIPYILLRVQVVHVPTWALVVEGFWYAIINGVTMSVFLYKEREGVGRFMW